MSAAEPTTRSHAALNRTGERKRMLVIVNPYATTVSDHLKRLVVSALAGTYEVEAVETQARDHATDLSRAAAREHYDLVVAFGGDGTVNEAAHGLVGSDTPLTCLPGGSNNVFARMLGIPDDIVDATEHLLAIADHWSPRPIDVGHVNDRHFLFASGVGLDAAVVEQADSKPALKARFRQSYFAWAAASVFTRRYIARPPALHVDFGDGPGVDGATVIVQNGDPYTYFHRRPIRIARNIALDSGDLAGAVLLRTSPTVMPGMGLRMLSGRLEVGDHRAAHPFDGATSFTVTSRDERPAPLHVDGDHLGDVTRAVYGVRPGALLVVA